MRLQKFRKIIKAFPCEMGFDGGMENNGEQLGRVPTCAPGAFDVLIRPETQNGADL
jgi:hypothetical protein